MSQRFERHIIKQITWKLLTGIKGSSQTSFSTPCNGIVSHGAQIGGSLPTTYCKTNAKHMCKWSSCSVQHFMHYLHNQITEIAGDIHTWWSMIILIMKRNRRKETEDPMYLHFPHMISVTHSWIKTSHNFGENAEKDSWFSYQATFKLYAKFSFSQNWDV